MARKRNIKITQSGIYPLPLFLKFKIPRETLAELHERNVLYQRIFKIKNLTELKKLLFHNDPLIRRRAIVALANNLKSTSHSHHTILKAIELFKELEKDADSRVRKAAAKWRRFLEKMLSERI